MVEIKCPGCQSIENKYVDKYIHVIKEDQEYLGEMDLYQCLECGLGFAHPFPDLSKLDHYYKEVYRKPLRPHYVKDPEKTNPGLWQRAQYAYLSQFVDFEKICSVADFWPWIWILTAIIAGKTS